MSLLDAYAPVPSRCERGDHSICDHAPADEPIMVPYQDQDGPVMTRFERDLAAGRRAADPTTRRDHINAAMNRAARGYTCQRRERS